MSIQAQAIVYKELNFDVSKTLEVAKFTIDPSQLKSNQIIVKTLGTPVNPSDVVQIKGVYPGASFTRNFGPGYEKVSVGGNEGLFEVTHVGSDVKDYKVGDQLVPSSAGFGTWRTHGVFDVDPKSLPFIVIGDKNASVTVKQGATITVNPITALQIIHQFVKDWKAGEWIIVDAGTSQVTQYLTQIAKSLGIKTISIVRDGKTKEQKDVLYKLGATVVVDESTFLSEDFPTKTLKEIAGEGANIRLAVNCVGGPYTKRFVQSLSQDGVLATYGFISGNNEVSFQLSDQLYKNISSHAYWLTYNTKKDPSSKVKGLKEIAKLYEDGVIEVPPVNEVVVDAKTDYLKAYLDAINGSGKTVLEYEF